MHILGIEFQCVEPAQLPLVPGVIIMIVGTLMVIYSARLSFLTGF